MLHELTGMLLTNCALPDNVDDILVVLSLLVADVGLEQDSSAEWASGVSAQPLGDSFFMEGMVAHRKHTDDLVNFVIDQTDRA